MARRDWIGAFAERAGIRDRREAEGSARRIAYELGGCLTWVESQNMADELPEPLAGALREGSFVTAMARFSARAFVSRIAERDGVGVEEAGRRAAALLSLLREWLPGAEVAQLNEELARWGAAPAP